MSQDIHITVPDPEPAAPPPSEIPGEVITMAETLGRVQAELAEAQSRLATLEARPPQSEVIISAPIVEPEPEPEPEPEVEIVEVPPPPAAPSADVDAPAKPKQTRGVLATWMLGKLPEK